MRLHRPFGKLPDTTGSMLGSDNRRYTTIRTDHPPFVESVNRIHKHSMGLTIHLESTWTMLRHTRQGPIPNRVGRRSYRWSPKPDWMARTNWDIGFEIASDTSCFTITSSHSVRRQKDSVRSSCCFGSHTYRNRFFRRRLVVAAGAWFHSPWMLHIKTNRTRAVQSDSAQMICSQIK